MTAEREGGCRCGQVRFRASVEPMITAACHCTGCQRMTASAFSLTSIYPSSAFEVTAGEPVIGGTRAPELRHFFCPSCMSWLFTRPQGMDEIVNVRTTMFDDPDLEPPFLETFTGEMLPWAETGAIHSYQSFPPFERFPELLRAYAAHRAQGRA